MFRNQKCFQSYIAISPKNLVFQIYINAMIIKSNCPPYFSNFIFCNYVLWCELEIFKHIFKALSLTSLYTGEEWDSNTAQILITII